MSGYARNLITDLGPLRAVLLLLGLLSAALPPPPRAATAYAGRRPLNGRKSEQCLT